MNFTLPFNLTRAASISIVSSVWNQHGIIVDIKHHLLATENCKTWLDIQSDVGLLLEKIFCPSAIKLDLKNLVRLMGTEVCKWISLTKPLFQYASHSPESLIFVWSETGIFNCDKTTDLIIKSCSDKVLCFCLASMFSLEQAMHELWLDVHQSMIEMVSNPSSVDLPAPIDFWVRYLSSYSHIPIQMQYYKFAFRKISEEEPRCVSTLNYFLIQIKPEVRKALVLQTLELVLKTSRPRDRNLVVCLFSKLSEDDASKMMKFNCYGVLTSFLIWPYTEFFVPLMDSNWKHLSQIDYLKLLEDMFQFASELYEGNVYKHIFKQVWLSTPLPFKQYIIKKCVTGSLLSRLFLRENTDDMMQIIFNDCSAERKEQIIFHFEGMNLCDLLAKKERWCSLELLIKNCIPCKIILEKFICNYENYRPYYYNQDTQLRTTALLEKIKVWYK